MRLLRWAASPLSLPSFLPALVLRVGSRWHRQNAARATGPARLANVALRITSFAQLALQRPSQNKGLRLRAGKRGYLHSLAPLLLTGWASLAGSFACAGSLAESERQKGKKTSTWPRPRSLFQPRLTTTWLRVTSHLPRCNESRAQDVHVIVGRRRSAFETRFKRCKKK